MFRPFKLSSSGHS